MEMVRAIRDRFYEDTKNLSREELINFIRRNATKTPQHEIDVIDTA
jgi:hypothetical protein